MKYGNLVCFRLAQTAYMTQQYTPYQPIFKFISYQGLMPKRNSFRRDIQ